MFPVLLATVPRAERDRHLLYSNTGCCGGQCLQRRGVWLVIIILSSAVSQLQRWIPRPPIHSLPPRLTVDAAATIDADKGPLNRVNDGDENNAV